MAARKLRSGIRRFVAANRALCQACERRCPHFFGFPSYQDDLRRRIDADLAARPGDVLEVGGIDRPFLSKGNGYRYVGMDIEEKPQCHQIYDWFIGQSIEQPIDGEYGVIMSITLLEHVRDNVASLQNIFDALRPGCSTHHYVPGKGHPYPLALRTVGARWQKRLIPILRPATVEETGYRTYFHCCSAKEMVNLFREVGFEEIRIRSFYRANDYFAFFFPAFIAVTAFENLCERFGWDYFASGFVISGRRPNSSSVVGSG